MRRARLRWSRRDLLNLVVAGESTSWLPAVAELEGFDPDLSRVVAPAVLARRAASLWARGRADRRIAARFALRNLAGILGAAAVRADTTVVYAANLSAATAFRAARRHAPSARLVLVEDMADLGQLHADLDRAATVHPDARFLRRYRASPRVVERQAAERALADLLIVRSEFARQCRIAAGVPASRVVVLPVIEAEVKPAGRSTGRTLLLAGLASARAGLYEAIAMLDFVPDVTLAIRAGEGLEPPDAMQRERVRAATHRELAELDGIDLVIAPSWCEADLPEVALAARRGVPIVATDRAAGGACLAAHRLIEPGDVAALSAAVRD